MTTNPFLEKIETLQREQAKIKSDLRQWEEDLAWFKSYDPEQRNRDLKNTQRSEVESQAKLHQARQEVLRLESSIKELEAKASIGIDPRYWFSSERIVAKQELAEEQRKLIAEKLSAWDIKNNISTVANLVAKIQDEISKASKFDLLLAQSAILALQAELDRIDPQLASLEQRSADLDDVLREPLVRLHQLKTEQTQLNRNISRAQYFEDALTNAPNSYEKRKIHEQCERELGDSRPGNVLRQNKSELRTVDSSIKKLQARVDQIIQFATHDIQHIVIDANNLCYEGRHFLGLVALEALVPILLTQSYKVTLIFDASIRRKLELNNKDIESRFPQMAQVHIVASKQKADETVLATACDPHAFVLSNDRFVDYPEQMAVKEDRMLRHEIVNQAIHIHNLHITANFS